MKHTHFIKGAVAGVVMLGAMQTANAQCVGTECGTNAGVGVDNVASVTYSIGGNAQPAQNSNTDTFTVDRRINLVVAEVGNNFNTGFDSLSPSTNQSLTFTVQNQSNSTQDIGLSYTQTATGSAGPAAPHAAAGALDAFDTTNVRFFLDNGATPGVFDPTDTLITFLDEVPEGATRTVHVVTDIPTGRISGDISAGSLVAQAREAGVVGGAQGAISTATPLANADTQGGAPDTVFGDAAGTADAARDGQHSDDDAYRIAVLTITKSSRVVSDPINLTTNPKRIPGAVVEYCVTVTNGFATPATGVTVTDDITGDPVVFTANAYAAGSSIYEGSTSCASNTGGAGPRTNAADADNANITGNVATINFGSVAGGATTRVQFRVTIN